MQSAGHWEPSHLFETETVPERKDIPCFFVTWPCLLPAGDPEHQAHKWSILVICVVSDPLQTFCRDCGHTAAEIMEVKEWI